MPEPSAFGHFQPLGHARQTAAPPNEKVPGEQRISVEFLVDGQYLPAGHTVQYCARSSEYVPYERKMNTFIDSENSHSTCL